jgi:hypothetical protein
MSAFPVDECVSSQTIRSIKSLGFPVESLQQFEALFIVDRNKYRKRRK